MTVVTSYANTASRFAEEIEGSIYVGFSRFRSNALGEISTICVEAVTIPTGATINSAILNVYIDLSAMDEPYHTVDAERTANATCPASGNASGSISSRTGTTATIAWGDGSDLVPAAPGFYDVDVTTIVQELQGLYDFSLGGDMLFRFTWAASPGDLGIATPAGDPTWIATLTVDYTAGGGSTTIIVSESSAGSDALSSLGAALSVSETGVGSDALSSLGVSLSVSETGAGNDTLPSLGAALSVSDTGIGTDTTSETVFAQLQDVSIAVDAMSGSAALSVSDTSSGSDTATLNIFVTVLEGAAGADLLSGISAAVSISEISTASDVESIIVSLSVGEQSTANDTIGSIQAILSVLDSASNSDVVAAYLLISVSDAGQALDSILSLSAVVQAGETSLGLDELGITASLTVSDGAAAADTLSVLMGTILKTVFDTGTSSDTPPTITAASSVSDFTSGTDTLGVSVVVAVSDVSTSLDATTVITAIQKLVADIAQSTDGIPSTMVLATVSDLFSGVENLGIAVTLTVSDNGLGQITVSVNNGEGDVLFRIAIIDNTRNVIIREAGDRWTVIRETGDRRVVITPKFEG